MRVWFYCIALLCLLTGCATTGVFSAKDSAPKETLNPDHIPDAVPRKELITRAGNTSPYTVLGKTYHVMPSAKGYQEEGIASWYGTKFHGRPTANGERYSLYEMTAAHKSLPIPSYVEVVNLENGRKAIVRVNDRGPFHDQRIIDLSYAAAVKLGYANQGTARVALRAIHVEDETPEPTAANTPDAHRYYLQAGSFKSLNSAQSLRARLLMLTAEDVRIEASQPAGFYRVRIGPLNTYQQVDQLTALLEKEGLPKPRLLTE